MVINKLLGIIFIVLIMTSGCMTIGERCSSGLAAREYNGDYSLCYMMEQRKMEAAMQQWVEIEKASEKRKARLYCYKTGSSVQCYEQ